ncbi:hypothetical protein AKJ37_01340 [candidate division MSBL1 archaeon SCGC-AAA259I09]|uniref:Exosome complex component Rrp4 n=3 Tax=candidate division MSBL1 TaxID=215777 RepID=A0A133UVC5_9EURY|nr:hypothetical protein AKJ62_00475 [candidate division MSBL1 archaeon SCGC-AAA259D14]KXA93571.1 hypothetical protein AKJ66_01690 [candidate division MSBL1 archaeon SCGC-AAA259E22]KXA98080.1 hypothetical protein AKJ37_01340 [candidate division MSBL1 archaeon SCGC-AAA259I09]
MMHVEKRELVVPGQLIAEGDYKLGDGVFKDDNVIRASQMGLADKRGNKIRVIPLEGRYIPKEGDRVIGIAVDDYHAGWMLEINAPYLGNLSVSSLLQRKVDLDKEDISKFLEVGDAVEARIQDVDELMKILLEVTENEKGRISGGRLVEINPSRIPRVIGRKGSMISILQKEGECELSVGQNGRIMVWGDDKKKVNKVIEAIFKIEREAHISGLTDRIKEFLQKDSKGG